MTAVTWARERDATPRWLPLNAPAQNREGERSPWLLRAIVDQFDVANSPRYAPEDGKTWCNVYLWDVTSALCCEVPHWVDDDGEPAAVGEGHETRANDLPGWLDGPGHARGWRLTSLAEARQAAGLGWPAVVCWVNPRGGPGHVALLVPGGDEDDPRIAQAGRECFSDGPLSRGFGTREVIAWVHP